ncbi:MAG: hypothetical protein D6767_08455 [Candidatus Hydrogenedentota bacterium]|nr:MAG: hypothetical protein D6767_08455 [Candidatus Hydrogenedentota bacterium]
MKQHIPDEQLAIAELSDAQKRHLKTCKRCHKLRAQYLTLSLAILAIPQKKAPLGFRKKLMERITRPAYSLTQLIISSLALSVSPFVIHRFHHVFKDTSFGNEIMIFSYVLLSFMTVFFFFPLVLQVSDKFPDAAHKLAVKFDWILSRTK